MEIRNRIPHFLCIGAMKAGTTWLHRLLLTHPDIKIVSVPKEVFFFDLNYYKGPMWYRKVLLNNKRQHDNKLYGEVTTTYLSDPNVPKRIYKYNPNIKLIVILRNPIDRSFSHYKHLIKTKFENRDFSTVLKEEKEILERSLYSEQVARYLNFFHKEQMLFLIFEKDIVNPIECVKKVSEFLCIDAEKFDLSISNRKINESYVPKYRIILRYYRLIRKVIINLRLFSLVKYLRRFEIQRHFISTKKLPLLTLNEKEFYYILYFKKNIEQLESLLDIDLSIWKAAL